MSAYTLKRKMLNVTSGSVRTAMGAPEKLSLAQNSVRTPGTPGEPGGDCTDDDSGCAPVKMPSPDAIRSVPGAERTSTPAGARSVRPFRSPTEAPGMVTNAEPPSRAGRSVSAPITAMESMRSGSSGSTRARGPP
jgi:hypothetical protein